MDGASGPGSPRSTGRRRILLGAAALVVAALVVLLLWPRADAGDAHAASAPAVSAAPPPPPDEAVPAAAVTPDLPESVQRYLEATVYPSDSGRLSADSYDLLHPNTRYEQPRPIAETISDDPDAVVRYLLTADAYHLEAGATAHATLAAWRGSTPIPGAIQVLEASMVAEGCAGAEGERVPVAFVPRGDALEADLPFSRFDDHHGSVLLEVRFLASGAEPQSDSLRFFHTPRTRIPAIVLPDRMRDTVVKGSLRLDLGVDVRDPGFYRFDANLFGPGGKPVAFTSWKGELGTGAQSVPLEVYGKVLRDAGVPGPYRLAGIRGYRFLDGGCPDRENLAASDASYTTAPYPLGAFTDQPFMDEHKQHMIDMMLADAAKGIGPEWPALASPQAESEPPPGPDDDYEPPPPPPATPRSP